MSTMEMEISRINENCTKCLEKCRECTCKYVSKLMNFAEKLEKEGLMTKEDKDAYMTFLRG